MNDPVHDESFKKQISQYALSEDRGVSFNQCRAEKF